LEDEVSNDLLGASPDVRRLGGKKNVMLDYMRKAMMQKLGGGFTINPQPMIDIGSLLANKVPKTSTKQNERRTVLRIRETDDN
jgi:hypothetical protein